LLANALDVALKEIYTGTGSHKFYNTDYNYH